MNRVLGAFAAFSAFSVAGCAIQVDVQKAHSWTDLAPRVSLFRDSAANTEMVAKKACPVATQQMAARRYGISTAEARERLARARSTDSTKFAQSPAPENELIQPPGELVAESAKPIGVAKPLPNRFQLAASKAPLAANGDPLNTLQSANAPTSERWSATAVDPLMNDKTLFDEESEIPESTIEPGRLPDFEPTVKPVRVPDGGNEPAEFNPFADLPAAPPAKALPKSRASAANDASNTENVNPENDSSTTVAKQDRTSALFDGPATSNSRAAEKKAIVQIERLLANLKSEQNSSGQDESAKPNPTTPLQTRSNSNDEAAANSAKDVITPMSYVSAETDSAEPSFLHTVRCRVRIRRTGKTPATNVIVGMSLPSEMRFDKAIGPTRAVVQKNEIEFAAISKLSHDAESSFDVTMLLPTINDIGLRVRIQDDQADDDSHDAWSISIERLTAKRNQ